MVGKRRKIGVAVDLFGDVMLIVLAVNLLSLYYTGGWIEANPIIRIAELVFLYALILFGLARGVYHMREAILHENADEEVDHAH